MSDAAFWLAIFVLMSGSFTAGFVSCGLVNSRGKGEP